MPQEIPTPAIYSQSIKTKGQTYFFDVRAAKNGSKYLSISQSWMREGQKHRSNLTVFSDNLTEFCQTLEDLKTKVQ